MTRSASYLHHEQLNLTSLCHEDSGNPTATARLNYYRSNTNRLLDFLRQSNRDSLDRFISVVRSGASHDDIFATIDQLSPSAGEQRSKQNGVPS